MKEKPIIAQKLYAARKLAGLNAQDVADGSMGLFRKGAIQSWEAGNRTFPKDNAKIVDYFCRFFSISPGYLLDDGIPVNAPNRVVEQSEIKTEVSRDVPFFSSFPISAAKAHTSFPTWGRNSARKATYAKIDFEDLIKEGDILLVDDDVKTFAVDDLVLIWRKNVLDIIHYDPNQEEVEVVARITGVFKDFDVHKSRAMG